MFKKALLTICILVLSFTAKAQFNLSDSATMLFPLNLGYSYQLPSATLAERFGPNHNISFGAEAKLRSNYIFGVQGGFIFGNKIRQGGLLENVINSNGQILNTEGLPATVLVQERGFSVLGYAGKIIPIVGPNKNSGIMLRLGGGVLRHKIRIETQNDVVPQLEDDNLEGYDRLAAGPAAYLYVGYRHFSNRRLVNFHVGFEIIQGFTEPLRAFNFDTETVDEDTRFDGLSGLRFSWTFPIYRDKPQKIFLQ